MFSDDTFVYSSNFFTTVDNCQHIPGLEKHTRAMTDFMLYVCP